MADALASMPELDELRPMLERSHRGLLFDDETSARVKPLLARLIEARGIRRLSLFWDIMNVLVTAPEPEVLASLSYELDLEGLKEGASIGPSPICGSI